MELRQVNNCTHTTSYNTNLWSSLVSIKSVFHEGGCRRSVCASCQRWENCGQNKKGYLSMTFDVYLCVVVILARPCVHLVVTRPAWSYWWSTTTRCTTWTSASSPYTGTWECTSTGRTWASSSGIGLLETSSDAQPGLCCTQLYVVLDSGVFLPSDLSLAGETHEVMWLIQ